MQENPIYSPKIVEQSQITAFDKSANVRRATAFAISVINDKETIPLLINLLKDQMEMSETGPHLQ